MNKKDNEAIKALERGMRKNTAKEEKNEKNKDV